MVVDQANLNAKQEPFSRVNNRLAADCLFSRATQWGVGGGHKIDVHELRVCVREGVLCIFKTFQHREKNLRYKMIVYSCGSNCWEGERATKARHRTERVPLNSIKTLCRGSLNHKEMRARQQSRGNRTSDSTMGPHCF